jgi:hemolysin activation/secretion protein
MFAMTIPPAQAEAAPVVAGARPVDAQAAAPLRVDSHGFGYTVRGNTLLDPAEVSAALASGATPEQAIGALKQAYARKGWFLVAVLARVQGQAVQVDVVQGRLAHVEGPPALAAYFSGLLGRDSVRNSEVVRRGLLAQAYAATNGEQPQVRFVPAAEKGASTLTLDTVPLPDSRTASGSLTVGNLGNRYAGHDLAQVQGQLQHDGFTVQATHSRALTGIDEDSRGAYYAATGLTVSKVTPLGWFQLDGNWTRYALGKAFAPLNPAGTVKLFGGSATQLLFADDARRWSLSEGLHRVADRETVFNGAYALRDQRYDVLDVGSQASWRFKAMAGRNATVNLSAGLKLGGLGGARGFSAGVGMPASHFHIYTAHAGAEQALAGGYSLQLDASAQATPDTLPSYEQWVLGGLNTLGAYLPGTLVGDRGYLGRMSLQAPTWQWGALRLRPNLFVEHGAARYHYTPPGSPLWQALDDAGASLGLELPNLGAHALVAYAKPFGAHEVTGEVRSRQRAHTFLYLQWDL